MSPDQIHEDNHWLWHGVLPFAAYALAVFAGTAQLVTDWSLLFIGLALAEMTLLLCAIRNTWLLVLWIARQR